MAVKLQKKKSNSTAIGFHCNPEGFCYVVLKGTQQNPTLASSDSKNKCSFPKFMSGRGEKLGWLRDQIFQILEEHQPDKAGMKRAATQFRGPSPERSEIEGVIKEAVFASRKIECIPRLIIQLRKDIHSFDDSEKDLEKLLDKLKLKDINNNIYKEAAWAAIAELPSK